MSGIELVSAERFEHGTRSRYVKGCRCEPCRKANREYAKARAHAAFNGLINSDEARLHLDLLAKNGVGLRSVADVAGIGRSVLQRITKGKRARADVIRRVLEVDRTAAADRALVPGGPTWSAIGEMLRLGLTKGEIAQRIGLETPALQLKKKRVTRRNEHSVLKLLLEVREETKGPPEICPDCGEQHDPETRLRWLARIDASDRDLEIIRQERSCWYPRTESGDRKLHRDLKTLRERRLQ